MRRRARRPRERSTRRRALATERRANRRAARRLPPSPRVVALVVVRGRGRVSGWVPGRGEGANTRGRSRASPGTVPSRGSVGTAGISSRGTPRRRGSTAARAPREGARRSGRVGRGARRKSGRASRARPRRPPSGDRERVRASRTARLVSEASARAPRNSPISRRRSRCSWFFASHLAHASSSSSLLSTSGCAPGEERMRVRVQRAGQARRAGRERMSNFQTELGTGARAAMRGVKRGDAKRTQRTSINFTCPSTIFSDRERFS